MKKHTPPPNVACVKVIANSAETLDGLHAYLARFGISSSGTRSLSDAKKLPTNVTATVLFPDDFDAADVVSAVEALRRARPQVLIVLVTATPQRFGKLASKDGARKSPVVLAKPALGWTLVDVLRDSGAP